MRVLLMVLDSSVLCYLSLCNDRRPRSIQRFPAAFPSWCLKQAPPSSYLALPLSPTLLWVLAMWSSLPFSEQIMFVFVPHTLHSGFPNQSHTSKSPFLLKTFADIPDWDPFLLSLAFFSPKDIWVEWICHEANEAYIWGRLTWTALSPRLGT